MTIPIRLEESRLTADVETVDWERLADFPEPDPLPNPFTGDITFTTNTGASTSAYVSYGQNSDGTFIRIEDPEPGVSVNNEERRNEMANEQQPTISVQDAIRCLEQFYRTDKFPEGIIVPKDYGNHAYCSMDSNCPEAVKVRKVLEEAGIELKDLIDCWLTREGDPPPPPFQWRDIDVSGKAYVNIGGSRVEVDIGNTIQWQLEDQMNRKWQQFQRFQQHYSSLARDMFHAYAYHFIEARRVKGLPQLSFPIKDMLQYRCMITSCNQESYAFIFPFHYEPEHIYANRKVYRIHQDHRTVLARDVYVYLTVWINKEIAEPSLIYENGSKFEHYHGHGYDCWGAVKQIKKWDGKLSSLYQYVKMLENAQKTINRDSLMMTNPAGFPAFPDVFAASKYLGKEGEYKEGSGEEDVDDGKPLAKDKKTWGNGRPLDAEQQEELAMAREEDANDR